jgi:hypothetical protein
MRTGSRRCCTEGHHFLHHSIAPGGAEGRQAERDHHAEDFVELDYENRSRCDRHLVAILARGRSSPGQIVPARPAWLCFPPA